MSFSTFSVQVPTPGTPTITEALNRFRVPSAAPSITKTVTLVILFDFKEHVSAEQMIAVSRHMFNLKNTCINPMTKAPYIQSVRGGANSSPRDKVNGMTHIFILEFEIEEEKDYFVDEEPVYDRLKVACNRFIQRVQVLGFTNGVFSLEEWFMGLADNPIYGNTRINEDIHINEENHTHEDIQINDANPINEENAANGVE
ncbi:hypothetical protein M501DRAFT_1060034 [Patellaria atrata CBS 101060]|uniref:Stress-response A/B barrel domain-containing protein n=1 Tax=Patellaria atrata CBS 101060 TaxID=1346257 RepID=A0A9P4S5T1_9PEZI|nr:hypothetical protein M501DRAFT_1060034 [Patellaria atrata CBS 101060]